MKQLAYAFVLLFSLSALPALAQDDELDVTLSVVEDGAAEEQLVNDIALPADADEQAQENASFGMETANEARQQGRDFGADRAEQGQDNAGEAPPEGLPTP